VQFKSEVGLLGYTPLHTCGTRSSATRMLALTLPSCLSGTPTTIAMLTSMIGRPANSQIGLSPPLSSTTGTPSSVDFRWTLTISDRSKRTKIRIILIMEKDQHPQRITKEELAEYRGLAKECGIFVPGKVRVRPRNPVTKKSREQRRNEFFSHFDCNFDISSQQQHQSKDI
jgi:hypothetical protein